MNINLGQYGKFITAIVGLALTILTTKYGSTSWMPYVVAAAGALGVYGVPNAPKMLQVAGEVIQTVEHQGAVPAPIKTVPAAPHVPGAPLSTPLNVMEASTGPRNPGSSSGAAGSAPVE